jgi:hypothetical protein
VSRCLPRSLADEKRVCSLTRPGQRRASLAQHGSARFPMLAARFLCAARTSRIESAYFVVVEERAPLLAPLAEAGACEPARSLVQDSGAPAWLSTAVRDSRCSQPVRSWERLRYPMLHADPENGVLEPCVWS